MENPNTLSLLHPNVAGIIETDFEKQNGELNDLNKVNKEIDKLIETIKELNNLKN